MRVFQKRLQNLFTLVFFLSTISACSNSNQHLLEKVHLTATQTAQPSFTPSLTSTPTLTPTPKPINKLARVCDEGWATIQDTSNLNGSLVYSAENGVILFDISSSNTKRIFTGVRYPDVSISPNRTTIATEETRWNGFKIIQQRIRIASNGKETSIVLPETIWVSYFIDDQKIFLTSQDVLDENYVGSGTTDKFYILSLDKEKFSANSVFLPKFSLREHQFKGPNDNMNPPWTEYSPNLKYVVYPIQQGWDKNFILNIENGNTTLFDWDKNSFAAPYPFWRPDSMALTIVKPDDDSRENYFNIDLGGNLTQLTRLKDIADWYFLESSGQWSPNSRFLAFPIYFSAKTTEGNSGTIYILDTQTGHILDLCYSEPWPQLNGGFTWSLDSRYLAVYESGQTHIIDLGNKVLYNIQLNKATKLNAFPLRGWAAWELP